MIGGTGTTRLLVLLNVLLALCAAGTAAPAPAEIQAAAENQEPAPQQPIPSASAPSIGAPIAIVPVDADSSVTGALQVTGGKAIIATTGTITSGAKPTDVILPHRGTLRVCASTTVKLSTDSGAPAGETPGLMMALDQGAIETSFAIGRHSDVLLTPDFRILIGGPGASDVKIRLGQHGDTCVDNPGINAPYVVVSSVFDGGAYRVQPGQRVMFQHGSLQEVVDQEKEPCGCPPEARPGTNDFPLAQSAGLAPLSSPQPSPPPSPAPAPAPTAGSATPSQLNEPLVYQAPAAAANPAPAAPVPAAPPTATPAASPTQTTSAPPQAPKRGFFHRVGSFFRRIFGAE